MRPMTSTNHTAATQNHEAGPVEPSLSDDPFVQFKNERDYIAQSRHLKSTVAAMDWAATLIEQQAATITAKDERIAELEDALRREGVPTSNDKAALTAVAGKPISVLKAVASAPRAFDPNQKDSSDAL